MERWLPKVLTKIHEQAAQCHIAIAVKVKREMFELGVEDSDVISVLSELNEDEFEERLIGIADNDDWKITFRVVVLDVLVYIKLVLRETCFMVSFREDDDDDGE